MDEIDIANEVAQSFLERSLANIKKATAKKEYCDCGELIPESRQMATGGTDSCIDCALINESHANRKF